MMKPYRYNVGIALFNRDGRVWIGKSLTDGPEYVLPGLEWQMPQGGIDPDEDIIAAARRELVEETGITSVSMLMVTDEWWRYNFPPPLKPPSGHKLDAFAGQQQRYVAFRFEGDEREINLGATGPDFYPEFSQWRWASLDEVVAGVMPYKRENYRRMAEVFTRFERCVGL